MQSVLLDLSQVEHRNFNLCPHCERLGSDPVLGRMSESMPMISRSDGRNFHLLLADRPLPYPAERGQGPAQQISLCFWYTSKGERTTQSSVVLAPADWMLGSRIFRETEHIADLLADKLVRGFAPAVLYEFRDDTLHELGY